MVCYLLDANVIITAYRDYYRLDKIPVFWDWLVAKGKQGLIKIPPAIFEELRPPPNHTMTAWLSQPAVAEHLVLSQNPDTALIDRVLAEGYGPNLTRRERRHVYKDATLIASALSMGKQLGVVVTKETSNKHVVRPHKRKIPDVCESLKVRCMSDFRLYFDTLDFSVPRRDQR